MIRGRRAFTLIELVIVITILAILAAVAVPVFQNLQTQARNSAVRGALGGVRQAISIYRASEFARGNTSFTYPLIGQVCDQQDNGIGACTGVLSPKIMENGDLPPNSWAGSGVDPDKVGDGSPLSRGDYNSLIAVGWWYKQSAGEFWANSNQQGENWW